MGEIFGECGNNVGNFQLQWETVEVTHVGFASKLSKSKTVTRAGNIVQNILFQVEFSNY